MPTCDPCIGEKPKIGRIGSTPVWSRTWRRVGVRHLHRPDAHQSTVGPPIVGPGTSICKLNYTAYPGPTITVGQVVMHLESTGNVFNPCGYLVASVGENR